MIRRLLQALDPQRPTPRIDVNGRTNEVIEITVRYLRIFVHWRWVTTAW